MKKIAEHLFELNTIAGIQKRFLTVDLFKSVGRGGEVVFSTYDTMFWDYDNEECVTDWTQIKVSKTTEIVRSPDREWTIDWFNCFGCYLITGAGGVNIQSPWIDGTFIFPYLQGKESVSSHISQILKECQKSLPELHPEVTSKDIRVGATNVMLDNSDCSHYAASILGGWDLKNESAMFEYARNHREPLRLAANTLAGWPSPKRKVFPLRAVFINDQNRGQIDSFMQSLFDHNISLTTYGGGKMKAILYTTLASLLSQLENWATNSKTRVFIL